MTKKPRLAFVTNFCQHYRVKTFEILSDYLDVNFYFYSKANESYWLPEHGLRRGAFKHEYLSGLQIGKLQITFSLIKKLISGNYDIFISGVVGRFSLPVTFIISRLFKKKFILWTGIWMRIGTLFHRFIFPFLLHIYKNSDAIVVYGDHVKSYLISEGVIPGKIFIASHAIDNAQYDTVISDEEKQLLLASLKIDKQKKIVLFIGRFVEEKGLDYLLDAFSSLKNEDLILLLVGSGSDKELILNKIITLNITEKVLVLDYVPPKDTPLYYSISWIYILPSVTTISFKEPWGLVVNEAFNQGLPVIATDAVGAAAGGLVEDGINGFIVPERNSQALANAMQKILDDPDLREKMSQNARQKISSWDNEHMVEGFIKAIEYVTKGKNGKQIE